MHIDCIAENFCWVDELDLICVLRQICSCFLLWRNQVTSANPSGVNAQKAERNAQKAIRAADAIFATRRPEEIERELTVSRHGTQLPGKEVVRGPWSADGYLAVL
jgi:hypothetical protein